MLYYINMAEFVKRVGYAFFRGAVSVFDLSGGYYIPKSHFKPVRRPSDADMLRKDWETIGHDISRALLSHEGNCGVRPSTKA